MNETLKEALKAVPGLAPAVRWEKRRRREQEYRRVRLPSTVRVQVDRYLAQTTRPQLHIGSGPHPLAGWLNVDYEPSLPEVVYMDATQPFPLPDATFTHIFSEHMIEHVPYEGGLSMLRECHRVLRPGGRVRVATPDLMQLVNMYQVEKTTAQVRYLDFAHSHYFRAPKLHNECFLLNFFVREWGHQFVYDLPTLVHTLELAGFRDIVRCEIGSSSDPELCGREMHGQDHGDEWNAFETMVLEGRKG